MKDDYVYKGIELVIQPFGSFDKKSKNERKHGLPEIYYYDINDEETVHKAECNSLIKKYNKALKQLFQKYANSGH